MPSSVYTETEASQSWCLWTLALYRGAQKIQCLPNKNHFYLQHGFSVINNWVNYIFACKITKSLAGDGCPTLQTELILENHVHKDGWTEKLCHLYFMVIWKVKMQRSKTVRLYSISDNANICTRSEYFITVKLLKNLRLTVLKKSLEGLEGLEMV